MPMTRKELTALCTALPNTCADTPFHDDNWLVVRHRGNRKIFACIYLRGGALCLNLKCEPMQADFYRRVYTGVAPGYHMNHQHWNTVDVNADVPLEELQAMISHSYALTKPRRKIRGQHTKKG